MQLTSITHLSLDGVFQGPGGPTEDTSHGFDRGGWIGQFADEESGAFINEVFQNPAGFLLGRRTYDIWNGYWPRQTDPADLIAAKLNSLPKYVVSSTLKDPEWNNTKVLDGDVMQAIRDLKAQPGGELQVWGSGTLIRALLDQDLMDRVTLIVYPVIVGKGMRLFPENGPDRRLALEDSRTTPSGVTILSYRPTGRPEYARADE
jgi:dihydrofolate reductase